MTQDQPNRLDRIEATQAVHNQILNEKRDRTQGGAPSSALDKPNDNNKV